MDGHGLQVRWASKVQIGKFHQLVILIHFLMYGLRQLMTSCKACLILFCKSHLPKKVSEVQQKDWGFGAMETWIQILTLVQLGTNYLICLSLRLLKCRMQILRSPIECIQ